MRLYGEPRRAGCVSLLHKNHSGCPVTAIGSGAFSQPTGLTSITVPDSVTAIGSYAFNRCDGMTSVTIPDSVTNIGYSPFATRRPVIDK